jgi:hypothetical protein
MELRALLGPVQPNQMVRAAKGVRLARLNRTAKTTGNINVEQLMRLSRHRP